MKKSPLVKKLAALSIWITALASIHLGLIGLGYNIFSLPFFLVQFPYLIVPLHYIIGLAGIISLVLFFMAYNDSHCTYGWYERR